jgi:hypothetical protein
MNVNASSSKVTRALSFLLTKIVLNGVLARKLLIVEQKSSYLEFIYLQI